jgi:predicted ATP-grasp superfamily ATP-dependent carboligase
MKVYIYTDYHNRQRLEMLNTFLTNSGYQCIVTTSIDHLNREDDVIISTNVDFQFHIFKPYCKFDIYSMLDHKLEFYEYMVKNEHLCRDNNIHLIPCYNKSYNGPNVIKQFIMKGAKGYSGKYNTIEYDSINNIIKKYPQDFQIQDLMDVKHIYGVSLCCKEGKIISAYSYLTEGAITGTSFHADRNCEIRIPEVKQFLKSMIANLNLNGIIEVEFLIDCSDKIYIMECNPRISGSLRVPQYYDSIILTYIRTFHDTIIREMA